MVGLHQQSAPKQLINEVPSHEVMVNDKVGVLGFIYERRTRNRFILSEGGQMFFRIHKGGPIFFTTAKGRTKKTDDGPSQIDNPPLLLKNDSSPITLG